MTFLVPAHPKIYHIVHVDKLPAILSTGALLCDAMIRPREPAGTTIGMEKIKQRRLKLILKTYPALHVGDCVPFYFCPRSVMLYLLHMKNHPDITYDGGQELIIHIVADLQCVVKWANENGKRWAFTDSNAGSFYFNDYCNMHELCKIDWNAVNATYWQDCRGKKQAEFLIEEKLPWELIEHIGVYSLKYDKKVSSALSSASHRPSVEVKRNWYY